MLRPTHLLAALAFIGATSTARAADLFADEPAAVLRTDTFSAEAFTGYVKLDAKEYVYNVGGSGKLSQLDWNSNALALGGRIAFRPFDWLTIRARGWAAVESRGEMKDYDWLAGYSGMSSWTHYSSSPNTRIAQAWQGDISAAASIYDDGEFAMTGIGGYRYLTTKWNARGGAGIYSVDAFRDTLVNFPENQLGVAYRQTWETPYLGVGASYNVDDWSVTAEVIGSPFSMASADDHHALRSLIFKQNLGTAGMVGFNGGLEYRVTPLMSVTGRLEYTKYLVAKGSEKIYATTGGAATGYPSGTVGGEAETLLLSLGVKARL